MSYQSFLRNRPSYLGVVRRGFEPSPPLPPDPLQVFVSDMFSGGRLGAFFVNKLTALGEPALYSSLTSATPAVEGDPIGRKRDLSGNNLSAIALNSSARAVHPGLVYDGSNDIYQLALNDMFRGSRGALLGATFRVNTIDSTSKLILGATVEPTVGSDLFIFYVNGSQLRIGGRRNSGDSFQFVTVGTVAANTNYVTVAYINWEAGQATIRLNGEEFMANFQTPGLTDNNQRGVSIGGRYTGTANFPGRIGCEFFRDGSATSADIVRVSQFLAEYDGVVI